MTEKHKLLLATTNRGKAREFQYLFSGVPYHLVTMADEGFTTDVAETGKTFEENAALKASTLAMESGLLTLADDSGLEVDALGGEPGLLSHRYAGDNATDEDRVNFLLKKLDGVPEEKRTARFRCVIAVASPDNKIEMFSGECPGIIAFAPRGDNGFGYDPVFYVPEYGKTLAELPSDIKNKISHRGRAAVKAREYLSETSGKG